MMMRLAKSIAKVSSVLGLSLCFVGGISAQAMPAQKPAPKMAQKPDARPAIKAEAINKQPAAKPVMAKPVVAKPLAAKPAAPKPAPKALAVAKPAPPKVETKTVPSPAIAVSAEEPPAAPAAEPVEPKRDPFVALVNNHKSGGGPSLPPGKAGLVVATVRVDGTVKSGSDLIAVVSNPERHVYFVRQGDQLYDGSVGRIDLDGVTFHENSKDAFGKPVVREVTKRIYATVGEQQ
jgi:Tfp pilus assembly protein PilP